MSTKNTSRSFIENRRQQPQKRPYISSDDPRVRVLQYDLVFVNNLPSEIACVDILSDELYFGRYGRVIKSILNPEIPYKKGVNYQAYGTYESELDASLAIVALHGITLYDRPLKVSYGTTKYCTFFLKGRQCTNDDCFYLHKILKQNEIINGDPKSMFKNQNLRAIKIVIDHLEEIIQRIFDSQTQKIEEGFPSLTETIDFLIDNEYLDEKKYYQIETKVKNQRNLKSTQNKSQILDSKKDLNQASNQIPEETPKFLKSNSFSTIASPNKPQTSTQFGDDDKIISQIDIKQKITSVGKINDNNELQSRTVRSDNETNKNYQIALDFDDKNEEKISQKIIKQIMNKKGLKSRFDFVKIDLKNTETIDEIKRVKNTIQRFLITFQ